MIADGLRGGLVGWGSWEYVPDWPRKGCENMETKTRIFGTADGGVNRAQRSRFQPTFAPSVVPRLQEKGRVSSAKITTRPSERGSFEPPLHAYRYSIIPT